VGAGLELAACYGLFTPPRPPVILPGAAGAALRLAGALRRASPFGLALAVLKGGVHFSGWRRAARPDHRRGFALGVRALLGFPLMKVWQPVHSLASGWWSAMSVWHSMQELRSALTVD